MVEVSVIGKLPQRAAESSSEVTAFDLLKTP